MAKVMIGAAMTETKTIRLGHARHIFIDSNRISLERRKVGPQPPMAFCTRLLTSTRKDGRVLGVICMFTVSHQRVDEVLLGILLKLLIQVCPRRRTSYITVSRYCIVS